MHHLDARNSSLRRRCFFALVLPLVVLVMVSTPSFGQAVPGSCPAAPDVVEDESCGESTNDGCALPQGWFTPIGYGEIICAQSWADGGNRDQDWYRLAVEDVDGSGRDRIQIQIRSSIPLLIRVFQDCFGPPVRITDCQFDAASLEWVTAFSVCAEQFSDVLIQATPGFVGSGPISTGFPCDIGYPYVITVDWDDQCDEALCPECSRSPEGMVAWWMMDEPAGDTLSVDVVGNHNMSHFGGVISGTPGIVDSAIELDGVSGHLRTPDAPFLNFEEDDDFSVMGWIRIDGNSSGPRVILGKTAFNQVPYGYIFGILGTGEAIFQIANSDGSRAVVQSPLPLPTDRWIHVAVTIDRDNAQGLRLYRDGILLATQDATAAPGSLSNDQPLYLGAYAGPNGPANFFAGSLDEIIMVDYPLTAESIQRVANARCGGSCKQRLHITRFTPFCDGDGQAEAVVTIFNDRNEPGTFDLNFDGTPQDGDDCQIDGPINFVADIQNPIVVAPQGKQEVVVTIGRPQGMLEDGDAGCWRAKLEDAIRVDQPTIRRAFVIQSDQVCVEPLEFLPGVQAIPIGEITPFTFVVHNRGNTPYNLMWKIRAVDSVSGEPINLLQLNNQEPGDPVLGMIQIPPDASELVTVEARWIFRRSDTKSTKGKILDVVMYEDPGKIDPDQGLGSKGGEAADRRSAVECVSSDLDCDGDVDVNDLLVMLAAYGECDPAADCPADLDGDGAVDVDDLLTLLAAYGTA